MAIFILNNLHVNERNIIHKLKLLFSTDHNSLSIMIGRTCEKPSQFMVMMHHYLQANKMTFDSFFRLFQSSKNDKLTWSEFTNLVACLMATFKIESVQVKHLFNSFKNKNEVIDLKQFKHQYFQVVGKTRSQSKSIQSSRKSRPISINRSLQNVNSSKDKEGNLKTAEMGLNYIITSGTVKQRLRKSMINLSGRLEVRRQKIQEFLRSCKIKELEIITIFKQIADKILSLLTVKHVQQPEGKFYREVLDLAKSISQDQNKGQMKNASENMISLKPKIATSRDSYQGRFQNVNSSRLQLTERITRLTERTASLERQEKIDQKTSKQFHFKTEESDQDKIYSFIEGQKMLKKKNQQFGSKRCTSKAEELNRQISRKLRFLKIHQQYKVTENTIKSKSKESPIRQTPRNIPKNHKVYNIGNCLTSPFRKNQQMKMVENSKKIFEALQPSQRNFSGFSLSESQNFQNVYPLAWKYYRYSRNPTNEELPFLAQLENLLKLKTIYQDNYNPPTTYDYMRADKLFNSPTYSVMKGHQMEFSSMVRQGSQGNSYFMAFLTSLVEKYPDFIKNKFMFRANPSRYYCVKIFIDGKQTIVKTDDQFPSKRKKLVFTSPPCKQIWVMLLQKVYAKVFNGYNNILHGSLAEVSQFLTGIPIFDANSIFNNDSSSTTLSNFFEDENVDEYVMVACPQQVNTQVQKHVEVVNGLMATSCYSILSQCGQVGYKVVKMRNPKGFNYFDSKDGSNYKFGCLFGEDRHQVQASMESGCFYLTEDQLYEYFAEVHVCKFKEAYKYSQLELRHDVNDEPGVYFAYLKMHGKGKYYISVVQPSIRRLKFLYPKESHQYAKCKMAIRSHSFSLEVHSQTFQRCGKEVELEAGFYEIKVVFESKDPIWKESNLICYGPGQLLQDEA